MASNCLRGTLCLPERSGGRDRLRGNPPRLPARRTSRATASSAAGSGRRAALDARFCAHHTDTHWFLEQGFAPTTQDALPVEKQQLYNWQRNASRIEAGQSDPA